MTSIQQPLDEDEQKYNVAHKRTRRCRETYEPGKCCKIIVPLMVLHSMCVNAQLLLDAGDGHDGDEERNEDAAAAAAAAAAADDDDVDDNDTDDAASTDLKAQQGTVQLRRNLAYDRFGKSRGCDFFCNS